MHAPINANLCGLWDGVHIWLQWADVSPETGYHIRMRLRQAGHPWQEWILVTNQGPFRRDWKVIPAWKNGHEVQAEVSVDGVEWSRAQEVTFLRSTCLFSFSSERRFQHYQAGGIFACIVDGAPCQYELMEEIEIERGGEVTAAMQAASTSGYCQLDYPGHFRINPSLGLVIQNVEPSVDDLRPTGRDFSVIESLVRNEPVRVTFGGGASNPFRGTV